MRKCELCNNQHDGKYGSGRFCGSSCARSFSTKSKRQEINLRVSRSLKKKRLERYCLECGNKLSINNQSGYCYKHFLKQDFIIFKMKKPHKPGAGGPRPGGGRSKALKYESPIAGKAMLNSEEIRVAKVLDQIKIQWTRNSQGFEYFDETGSLRRFYPDFYIKDLNCFLEYKGWITSKMKHKMEDAVRRNDLKLMIIYGNNKRYANLGLNLDQIENDPSYLIKMIESI